MKIIKDGRYEKTKGILISYLKNKIGNWISVNPNIISNQDTMNILNENKYYLSRFGDGEFNIIWGNDLFDNAANIRRILVPATNAFSLYNDILNECLNIDKDYLFILSIGPTASVLSSDLSEYGYQALDLGHIYLQYEYYLRQCCEKIKIIGKYNNEIDNGDKVEMINDEDYSNKIIKSIGC